MTNTIREEVFGYLRETYGAEPDNQTKYPDCAVFRHEDNQKQYALVSQISFEKIDRCRTGLTDVLNIRLQDLLLRDMLLQQEGYYIGYPVSRGNWISVLLDGSVPLATITHLIDVSYRTTASGRKKQAMRPPKEWLIPSNPKYYDIIHAFDAATTIEWKQGVGIKTGDTVFLYVGSPVSAILYKCIVTETDIPYANCSDKLTIRKLMKIRLIKRYALEQFPFERLKQEFGIFAVRGPRGVPDSLLKALEE